MTQKILVAKEAIFAGNICIAGPGATVSQAYYDLYAKTYGWKDKVESVDLPGPTNASGQVPTAKVTASKTDKS